MTYSFEILLISFFKILKYSFELRDINTAFANENILYVFCIKIIYIVFFEKYIYLSFM